MNHRQPQSQVRRVVPVRDIVLRDAVDRIFSDGFFSSPFRPAWGNGFNGAGGAGGSRTGIALDVYETPEEVVIIAAVPGLGPDDISVTVHESTVTLSGQLPNVAQSEDARQATWYIHELPYGHFQRSLKLPVEIDADGADASFDNGILHLHLPKASQARPRQITVRRSDAAPAPSLALPETERAQADLAPATAAAPNGHGDRAGIGEVIART